MIWGPRQVSRTALVVLAVTLLAAVAAVLVGRHLDGLRAERRAAAVAADSVTVLAGALRSKLAAGDVATSSDNPGESASAAAARGVSAAALSLARDSGRPQLDGAGAGAVVVARYATPATPTTVQERRDQVAGYVVVPLELERVLTSLVRDSGGISVSSPDRRLAAVPSAGPGPAASFTTSLGPDLPSGWVVTAWTTPTRTPLSAWLIAAFLGVVGVLVAGWVAVRQNESRRRLEELRGLQHTSATVAELATLAQHSLDLGEVLPAVTTELSAALGLRGLSVTAPTAFGERPIFVLGVPPDLDAPRQSLQQVAAGQTLALVLSRGGRVVATLRVTAGRFLGHAEVRTLLAAGEVLTSALTNAEVFTQQAELIDRMRTVDELKTVFLATASHELRTPVVALAGYASLLNANWDRLPPEDARNYAGRVDSIAQRLSRLVEDILDFSRLQSGSNLGANDVVLDLADTVGQVLEEQSDLAPDHTVLHRPGQGLPVCGSRQAVERVVTNLVGNAAKYSDLGSTIRVTTRENEGRAELVVDDDGPGIPADRREQVFSPFYRGSGDEVVRTRGAGLGLAIVAEFAGSMGGQVRVDEADGGGARFVVSYPISVVEPDTDPGAAHVQS